MVKKIKITIDKVAYGGSGIGRHNDIVVFVPFSAPGDELSVKIVEEKKHYWLGEIDALITPSSYRTQPPCPYFTVCGGCQLQHIDYSNQAIIKKTVVEDALTRLAKLSPVVLDPIGATDPWRYRNKTQYPLAYRQGVRVGYFERRTHRVIDVESCLIHPVEFDRLADFFRTAIKNSRERIYDETDHTGNLRHLILRKGFNTGECLVTVVTKTGRLAPALSAEITKKFPEIVGLVENENPERTNRIMGSRSRVISGRDFYYETVLGKKFKISAGSFFQVNTLQTEALLKTVVKFLEPSGSEEVIDLFAGVGTIGITIAPLVKNVTGIEIDEKAVEDAVENRKLNDITNIELIAGPVESALQKFERADAVVVDPPRKGCAAQLLSEIARLAPKKVVYVSCNPVTLARDLTVLNSFGFAAVEIQPVDLFPHTYHIETVTKIIRKIT